MWLGRWQGNRFRQWKAGEFGPRIVRWRAQELEYHRNELDLGFRLEQRLLQQKLRKDAPNGPHIDGR